MVRTTFADANEQRDRRIYAELARRLIRRARRSYVQEHFGLEFAQTVYAFDSTIIELCLTLFPWARFRQRKGGITLHTLLDLHGAILSFIRLVDAACHDVHGLDALPLEPGAFDLMDRSYVDYSRMYRFTEAGAFFVTCAKDGLRSWRQGFRPVPPNQGVHSDQLIRLSGRRTAASYPALLRRVAVLCALPSAVLADFDWCIDEDLTATTAVTAKEVEASPTRRFPPSIILTWVQLDRPVKAFCWRITICG